MTRTFLRPEEALADGDLAWSGGPLPYFGTCVDDCWLGPPAGAFSSVLDEARFLGFLREGNWDVLSDPYRQTMQRPKVDTRLLGDLISYGYALFTHRGFFLDDGLTFYDLVAITHAGSLGGPSYSSDFWYCPALDFGFITLSSGANAYFRRSLEVALETLCVLPPPASPPHLQVDPSSFGAYQGTYFDPFGVGTIVVTALGDELGVSLPDLDQAGVAYDPVLLPVCVDNFQLVVNDVVVPVTFIWDELGVAGYFRTRYFVAHRVEPALAAASPTGARRRAALPAEARTLARRQPRDRIDRVLRQMAASPPEPPSPFVYGRFARP
jgi:hypothetical protein